MLTNTSGRNEKVDKRDSGARKMMQVVSGWATIERGIEIRLMWCVRRKSGQRSAMYAKKDGARIVRILFFCIDGGI
jgi:hypothetical protein